MDEEILFFYRSWLLHSSRLCDGSAKVALIGIDRSISAWNILLPCFSDQERQILDLIALLENIRKRVEIQFPGARDFIRPGFDEIA